LPKKSSKPCTLGGCSLRLPLVLAKLTRRVTERFHDICYAGIEWAEPEFGAGQSDLGQTGPDRRLAGDESRGPATVLDPCCRRQSEAGCDAAKPMQRKLKTASLAACCDMGFDSDPGNGRMNRPAPKTVRRRFLKALGHAIHLTWPVLSIILAIQVALGLLIGFVEGWSVGDAMYFTFVTGLTIGYGDIVPRQALARALAIGVGVFGLFLTGVIAAAAVHAMRTALADSDNG